MHRFLIVGGLLLGAVLIAPVPARADDDDHPYNQRYYENRRYYDRDGRDYHVWNEHEHRAYRVYLGERHQQYREWRYVRRPERRAYFRWRHSHPDSVIIVAR